MTEVVSTAKAGVNGERGAPKKLSRVPFDQRDMIGAAGFRRLALRGAGTWDFNADASLLLE